MAVFSLPLILSEGYLRTGWLRPSVAVTIFALYPGDPVTSAIPFLSGNIGNIFYAVILAAASSLL
jgi:hypothetical protein